MNETLDLRLALGLDGNDIPPAAHGHDVLLQIFGVAGDQLLQGLLDLGVLVADLAADIGQEGRGLVCDHILGGNGAQDAILQTAVGDQAVKDLVQHGVKGVIAEVVVLQGARGTQNVCAIQQITGGEDGSLPCPLAGGGHVADAPEGGCALDVGKTAGVGGPPLAAQDGIGVLGGAQAARSGSRTLGLAKGLQHTAYFVELQRSDGFLGKAHDI